MLTMSWCFFSWDYKVLTEAYTSWYAKQVGLSLQLIHDADICGILVANTEPFTLQKPYFLAGVTLVL